MGIFSRDPNRLGSITRRLGAVEGDLEALRIRFANLSGEVIENLDRASKSRQRAEQSERKRAKAEENGGGDAPAMTIDQYRAHLESGGSSIPQVEQALGL